MDATPHKHEKTASLLKDLAGDFFARESSGPALVTVTHIELSPTRREAKVFLSVLPREHEAAVIGFSERHLRDFGEHIRSRSRMRLVPRFTFHIDEGEKHRQRIDELLNEAKKGIK